MQTDSYKCLRLGLWPVCRDPAEGIGLLFTCLDLLEGTNWHPVVQLWPLPFPGRPPIAPSMCSLLPYNIECVQTENGLFIRVVSQGTNDSYGGHQARSQGLFLGGASQSPRRYNLCPNKKNTNIDLEEGNISYPHLAILAARLR